MYKRSAALYDAVAWSVGKDYAAEAEFMRSALAQVASRPLHSLLDVACGTGGHLEHLRRHYEEVVGADLVTELLAVAEQRLPGVRLVEADMLTLELGRRFDAVICLGSSIAYVRTPENLQRAIHGMARHLEPGGVIALEPFFDADKFNWGRVSTRFVETPTLTVARFMTTGERGPVANTTMHYLVAERGEVSYFSEEHALGMFTTEQLLDAFRHAGLTPTFDAQGPSGRGLVIGLARQEL